MPRRTAPEGATPSAGPSPVRRAAVGLLLGAALGALAALLRPRGREEGAPWTGG